MGPKLVQTNQKQTIRFLCGCPFKFLFCDHPNGEDTLFSENTNMKKIAKQFESTSLETDFRMFEGASSFETIKGTGERDYNCLKVVWLNTPGQVVLPDLRSKSNLFKLSL